MENALGVTDAVVDSLTAQDFAHQVENGNLWVLPAGRQAGSKQPVLSLDRVRDLVARLRENFSYVVINAPPVDLSPEALLFGQLADGVILVLKANATRRETAVKVKQVVETAKVRLLGAILTDRTFPIPNALYRRL